MGGHGSGRYPPKARGQHLGHSEKARDARRAAREEREANARSSPEPGENGHAESPLDRTKTIETIGAPQPKPKASWTPLTKGWWKALGMSDTARIYMPVDWATAWVAAEILEQMVLEGYSASMVASWWNVVKGLHATRLDLLVKPEVPGSDAEPVDEDEEEASAGLADARAALQAVS